MTPLAYIIDHVQVVGWPTLLLFFWRAGRFIQKFEERLIKTENTIELVATNHLPHVTQGLEDVKNAVERGFSNLSNQLLILAGKATSAGCPVAKKDE